MDDTTIKTAPERIWLQVNADAGSCADFGEPFPHDTDGVTWCSEQVGGVEVEYVRADLVRAEMSEKTGNGDNK